MKKPSRFILAVQNNFSGKLKEGGSAATFFFNSQYKMKSVFNTIALTVVLLLSFTEWCECEAAPEIPHIMHSVSKTFVAADYVTSSVSESGVSKWLIG